MSALMINVNRPRVRMLIGRVSMSSTGRTSVFKSARTIANNSAVKNPDTYTPGSMYAVTITASVMTSQRINIFIIICDGIYSTYLHGYIHDKISIYASRNNFILK